MTLFEGVLGEAQEAGRDPVRLAACAGWPAWCSRRSCSMPSPPPSGGAPAGTKTSDAAEELWDLILFGIGAPGQ